MNAAELYQAGQLAEAISAATAAVKAKPADGSARFYLCELLCFAGDLERADKQLDALSQLDAEALPVISLFRQLVRAEQARVEFHQHGHLPEFLTQPTEELQLRLKASILIRENNLGEAAALLDQAEAARVRISGTCNGKPFEDCRDLDDLTASVLEVLTSTGKYYWIPLSSIDRLELHEPERPRDLLWRQAHLSVNDGPDGEVYLPTLYCGTAADSDDRLRLGRATEWHGDEGAPIRGVGQKMFIMDDDTHPIMELLDITLNSTPAT